MRKKGVAIERGRDEVFRSTKTTKSSILKTSILQLAGLETWYNQPLYQPRLKNKNSVIMWAFPLQRSLKSPGRYIRQYRSCIRICQLKAAVVWTCTVRSVQDWGWCCQIQHRKLIWARNLHNQRRLCHQHSRLQIVWSPRRKNMPRKHGLEKNQLQLCWCKWYFKFYCVYI